MSPATGPLAGLRIVEVGGIGPVPFCGLVLSDLGADVIRIDRTVASAAGSGMPDDLMRRGRRSVALDLKKPEGLEAARCLLRQADGLLEGFRPGVMERLGLGPEVCLKDNPRLVFGRMTGYGQQGSEADRAGHDINYLAGTGLLAAIGPSGGPPVIPLNLIGDFGGGGLLLAVGMLAALREAERSGQGQVVDAAMTDGSALLATMMFELLGRGQWTEERGSNLNDGGAPFYAVYETADVRHMAVGALERPFFETMMKVVGLDPDAVPDHNDRACWPQLRAQLTEAFRARTRDDWAAAFAGLDACVSPVLSLSEAAAGPVGFVDVDGHRQPAPAPRFSRTPPVPPRGSPDPGVHTDEVLLECGFERGQIDAMRQSGVIA